MKKLIVTLLIAGLSASSSATIINIPADWPTIQQGIDYSVDGDTVLVQPGTYFENINFYGHNILLASLFLTTGDTSYIEQTVIDGDSSGTVVIFENGEDNAIITGLKLTNGAAFYGGGIYCNGSSPTISNSIIISNISPHYGGGFYCHDAGPRIVNNRFLDNQAFLGAAIYCEGSEVVINDNIIYSNAAGYTSGGIFINATDSEIRRNVIFSNVAQERGGGICIYGSGITLAENSIYSNISFQHGGGIYNFSYDANIINNEVFSNTAHSDGGGIWFRRSGNVSNNVIFDNAAYRSGGGMYCRSFGINMINNTITANTANVKGGGIYIYSSYFTAKNSIIRGNTAAEYDEIYEEGSVPPMITYCNVGGGWEGAGNIDINPEFRGGDDYRLKSISCGYSIDSPCIDAGNPEILDSLLDCSWGLGTYRSDVGAYGGGIILPHSGIIINVPGDYPTIQDAVNHSENGDTVLVYPGTYVEHVNFYQHYITLGSLFMVNGDTAFISSTIIDGDSSGSVINLDNASNGTVRITGLTIENGGTSYGGGIRCIISNLNLNYNIFKNNTATRYGGAIYCYGSNALFENNSFINNRTSGSGGGVYCLSNAEIANNLFSGNSAEYYGGALVVDSANVIVTGNTIDSNAAWIGGGIHCIMAQSIEENTVKNNMASYSGGGISFGGRAAPLVTNNIIQDNGAIYSGGGIYIPQNTDPQISSNVIFGNSCITGGGIYIVSNSKISDNLINGNSAPFGGGIACQSYSPRIVNNEISGNYALMRGAGIYCQTNSNPTISGNIIYGNSGNGICLYHSYPDIIGNVIFGNSANIGAGIYNINSRPGVINTIIWGNYAPSGPQIRVEGTNEPILEHCDIQGGWPGGGNIDLDPLFRDIANGDFHLMSIACGDSADSPCIDAGHPAIADSLLDCQWGLSTVLSDMGAYGGGDSVAVGIFENMASLPDRFMLLQNYPNPFNAHTTIRFVLPEPRDVELTIYDLLGRQVEVLSDGYKPAGICAISWIASAYPSGIYFARLETKNATKSVKMLLLK